MEITKLYAEDGMVYFVGLKSKFSEEEVANEARKYLRIRRDQIHTGFAVKSKNEEFFVEIANGPYWCACRATK